MLPPFPHEDPQLLDPDQWKRTLADSGRICFLEVEVWEGAARTRLPSARYRKSGQALMVRYKCLERGWRRPFYAGPNYSWNKDESLEGRAFRFTDGTRYREDLYEYRPNGLVWAYRRRERNEDDGGPWTALDEYFDPDGGLAGFRWTRADTDTVVVAWWRGEPVTEEAFRDRSALLGRR